MRGSICGVLALAAGLALPMASQIQRNRPARVEMAHPRVVRLPYTAEYKITTVKTLANGSTITKEYTEVRVMDSQGRLIASKTSVPLSGDQTARTHVGVNDPVARINTSWDIPGQKAWVTAMPAMGAMRPSCATNNTVHTTPTAVAPRIQPVVEDLGTETIQGIEAHGRRTTTTIPAGAIGNDLPLARTDEEWTATAPGLRGLLVRRVFDDPQSEKMTKELVNFTQAEPDATVFQPPAEYEIVNKEVPTPACSGAVMSSPSTESTGQSFAPIPEPPPPSEQ
jgi:hypothetical protein